ncbi:MAG TPA: hypothetical protein VGC55_12950 [Dokdonella sp.]
MPRHAAISAQLDRIEAEVGKRAGALSDAGFWLWFNGETAPMLETMTGDLYAYARNRIDRMLRGVKRLQPAGRHE